MERRWNKWFLKVPIFQKQKNPENCGSSYPKQVTKSTKYYLDILALHGEFDRRAAISNFAESRTWMLKKASQMAIFGILRLASMQKKLKTAIFL